MTKKHKIGDLECGEYSNLNYVLILHRPENTASIQLLIELDENHKINSGHFESLNARWGLNHYYYELKSINVE